MTVSAPVRRPGSAELPAGFRIAMGNAVRRHPRPDGGVLLGGSPLRVFRLGAAAWADVGNLGSGGAVASGRSGQVAGRLVEVGLATPLPPGRGPAPSEVTIVVPAHDRPDALGRCLAGVGRAAEVLVVDDASGDPDRVAGVVAAAGARLHRRERNGGPAAARNTGTAICRTPYVAFVDSDCVPEPGWLARLLPHFDDPAVGAVAPRVIGVDASGWLGRYEQARSSLDLGDRPGPVRPRSRISYVPAAALVVRRTALGKGFDEALRVGEDVDLVWRLHAGGWRVQYEPAARVRHDHRVGLRQWARRKFDYGTSAGPLARRHPGQVPPAVTSLVALVPLALLRTGRPAGALAVAGLAAAGLARRLPRFPGRGVEAVRLAAEGCVTTAYGLATAAPRAWLPVSGWLLCRWPAARTTVAGGLLLGPVLGWWIRRPDLDPLRWTLAYLLDDACYCAGLWVGALQARTAGPLLPAIPELRFLRSPMRRSTSHPSRGNGSGKSATGRKAR